MVKRYTVSNKVEVIGYLYIDTEKDNTCNTCDRVLIRARIPVEKHPEFQEDCGIVELQNLPDELMDADTIIADYWPGWDELVQAVVNLGKLKITSPPESRWMPGSLRLWIVNGMHWTPPPITKTGDVRNETLQ